MMRIIQYLENDYIFQEAKKYNIDHVLLGAYTGNIGSWKVMEKCGGKFENIVIEDETGLPVKRYWIEIGG